MCVRYHDVSHLYNVKRGNGNGSKLLTVKMTAFTAAEIEKLLSLLAFIFRNNKGNVEMLY